MTNFGLTLYDFMLKRPGGEVNRGEMEEMLIKAGLPQVAEGSVSAWLNGTKFPPPGLPHYAAVVLELDYEQRCELALAYLEEYKDRKRGQGKSGAEPGADLAEVKSLEAGVRTRRADGEKEVQNRGSRGDGAGSRS